MHVAAPTSHADDARYRAQAHAITRAFERFPVSPSAALSSDPAEGLIPSDRLALDHPAPDTLDSPPINVIPDSQPEAIPHEPRQEPKRRRLDRPLSLGGVEQDPPPSTSSPNDPHPHNRDVQLPITIPQEIHPPPPPISTVPFSTHITPTLDMLTRRLNPARTYNPLLQTRALDQLERGYWSVRFTLRDPQDQPAPGSAVDVVCPPATSPQSWDIPSFRRFWSFLVDFVGKDARAGWGVWCVLEQDHLIAESAPAPGSMSVVLKVYAWGEVAMHIYLLLFLASERRIRGMGAKWQDFREETVIQMPGAS